MRIFPQTDRYQEFWIDLLKSDAAIASAFNNGLEIREFAWGGKTFTYPNLRITIDSVTPNNNTNCDDYTIGFRVLINSEKESSAESQQLTKLVAEFIMRTREYNSSYFKGLINVTLVSARPSIAYEREGHREWGSETIWQHRIRAKTP